jgi:hypothetical protein
MFRDNLTGGMSMSVFGIATSSCVIRGGFRGGVRGVRVTLLSHSNQLFQSLTISHHKFLYIVIF